MKTPLGSHQRDRLKMFFQKTEIVFLQKTEYRKQKGAFNMYINDFKNKQ